MRALLLTLFVAGSLFGQENPLGYVQGRVLSAFGMGPVAGAKVRTVVARGGRLVELGKTRTDGQGRYRVRYGAVNEPARLLVIAEGLAPAVLDLVAAPLGEGVLVQDVILDGGAKLRTHAVAKAKGQRARWMMTVPGSRVIDMEADPVLEASWRGRVAEFTQVPPGDVVLVFGGGDGGSAPLVIPWRMGLDKSDIPPISFTRGARVTFRVRAPGEAALEAEIVASAGAWHPDGGEEYRLRFSTRGRKVGPGLFDVELVDLPHGILDVIFRAGRLTKRVTAYPDATVRDVTLDDGVIVEGFVRSAVDRRAVAGASVWIGARRVVSDAAGRYRMVGLLPGAHAIRAMRRGLRTEEQQLIVMAADRRLKVDLELESLAVIEGQVRGPRNKVMPSVFVGAEREAVDARKSGVLVGAVTDAKGEYRLRVDGGRIELKAWPMDGRLGRVRRLEVRPDTRHVVNLEVEPGSTTLGTVTLTATSPAAGADIYLIEAAAPPEVLKSLHPVARLRPPRVHHVLTRADGSFRLGGLEPGPHHLIVRLPHEPPRRLDTVEITEGDDLRGFRFRAQHVPGLKVDAPAFTPIRLRSTEPGVPEVWACSEEEGEAVVRGLQPGLYEVGEVRPFGLPSYRERSVGSRVGDDPDRAAIVTDVPGEVAFSNARARARVETALTIGGAAPGAVGAEITFYPVAGLPGVGPQRLTGVVSPAGDFTRALPRGTWMAVARVPGYGEGRAGPFEIPHIVRTDTTVPLVLDVAPTAQVEGRVDIAQSVKGVLEGLRVIGRSAADRWIEPWRPGRRQAVVGRDGRFLLEGLPAGHVTLDFAGEVAAAQLFEDLVPTETVDLGDVLVSEGSWITAARVVTATGTEEEVSLPGRVTTSRRVFPGRYLVEAAMGGGGAAGVRERRLFTVDRGETNLDLDDRNRVEYLRGRLRLDNDRLAFHPFELLPSFDGLYDDRRSGFFMRSGRSGNITHSLPTGAYRLRFDYLDRRGHRYRHAFGVTVPRNRVAKIEETKTTRLDIRVVDDREKTLRGARVRVVSADFRGGVSASVVNRDTHHLVEAVTDDRGMVRFDRVPEGTWDIKVNHFEYGEGMVLGHEARRVSNEKFVVVELGPRRAIDIVTTTDAGLRLPGIELFLFRDELFLAEALEDRLFVTDHRGRARIEGVAPGRYLVVGQGPDHPAQSLGEVEVPIGADGYLEATVERGGSALVSVRDAGGSILPGARVDFAVEGGPFRYHGPRRRRIDELPLGLPQSGELFVRRLPQGACTITVTMDGYKPATLDGSISRGQVTRYDLILEKKRTRIRTPSQSRR